MKFSAIADATTAAALDLAWLYHALEPASSFGRRAFETREPFAPGEEAQAQTRVSHIMALAQRLEPGAIDAMRDALRSCPDPAPAISRASMDGVLEDAQFLELLRFLDVAARVELVVSGERAAALMRALEPGRAGRFGFYLADGFGPHLAAARARADAAQAAFDSARSKLAQRVAAQLGRDDVGSGEFIIMRASLQSLPPEVRVIREAPTYYLCELDLDDLALSALQRRDDAQNELAAAEQAERVRLSALVRSAATALEALLHAMAQADVDLAAARFAQQYECSAPEILAQPALRFRGGAFLPLAVNLSVQGRPYERIDVDLNRVAVLTGPNMGGKSAALRACGFVAVLASFGLPVPAQTCASALFEDVSWIGTGAVDDSAGLLSSYAAEVVRLAGVLSAGVRHGMLLLDEFARTTTPHEGGALLVAVLRSLERRGRVAFAATHLEHAARNAGVAHYAVRGLRELPSVTAAHGDLLAALEVLAQAMDYSVIAVDGDYYGKQSDALALARLLGLDEDIVAEAKENEWIP